MQGCGQFRAIASQAVYGGGRHALERAALIFIVTNQEHYFLIENLLKETKKAPKVSYLLEPKGRSTAPAISLAVRHIQKAYGDDAVCVLAADHLISDDAAFEEAVVQAAEQAQNGNLVVFGIRPTGPETGYGYLEIAAAGCGPQPLKSFVEKTLTEPRLSNISPKDAIIGTQGCFVSQPV